MAVFDSPTRALLDGKNFATVATLNPDGGPQSSVVWFERDGDTVLFSTTARRKKARNLARDPRISVSVYELGNPYNAVEIRGVAQLSEDVGRAVQREISQRYLGEDPPPESAEVVRLIVRIIPHTVSGFSV